ncbi:MAG: hypothetical protein ABIO48_00505 [Pedococcus sp.]
MVRRWQQLPLDHALSCMPRVRHLIDHLASATAPAGSPATAVPDLGPAVVIDQLAVLVYDACEAGSVDPPELATRLGDLRRELG